MAKAMLSVLLIHTALLGYGVLGRPLDLPVKIITTPSGDIFDCVDIYKQPAFDHPLLKDHKILMKPDVTFGNSPKVQMASNANITVLTSMDLEGGGCPEGTVPVHRLPKKNSTISPNDIQKPWSTLLAIRRSSRRQYYGAASLVNVYAVDQIGSGQVSGAMVWLRKTDEPVPTQGTLRAGWIVHPDKYNDKKTRMVIGFSRDGDEHVCYNLECPGFVQVNHNVALGAVVTQLSVYGGDQYGLYCHVYMDDKKNWWFSFEGYNNVVGYWPAELWQSMDYVTFVEYGGIVSCGQGQECPPMGNGHAWVSSDGKSCFMWQDEVVGPDHNWGGLSFWKQHQVVTQPSCHDAGSWHKDKIGYMFGFGGDVCSEKDSRAGHSDP